MAKYIQVGGGVELPVEQVVDLSDLTKGVEKEQTFVRDDALSSNGTMFFDYVGHDVRPRLVEMFGQPCPTAGGAVDGYKHEYVFRGPDGEPVTVYIQPLGRVADRGEE